MLFCRDKSIAKSVDTPCTVHGIVVRKLPVARYLQVMEALTHPIERILEAVFKGQDSAEILNGIQHLDKEAMQALMIKVLMAAPSEFVHLCGELLDIPQERLTEDNKDALTLTELMDVICAFWDKNDLSDFFAKGRALMGRMATRRETGSSASSPSD